MIIDGNGLPRDTGATDDMDSCRLAGVMVMIGHAKAPQMKSYVVNGNQGVRHPGTSPANNPKNFTRDQLILLAAGLFKQGEFTLAKELLLAAKARGWRAQNTEKDEPGSTKKFPDGPDWLSPSVRNHLRRCAKEKTTITGNVFLVVDIVFNAIFTSTRENNQLLALCEVAGKNWVFFYGMITPRWKDAVYNYWNSWRGELELAKDLVTFLQRYM